MKEYTVRITRQAREHLQEIKRYISIVLLAPDAANNTIITLKKEIKSLSVASVGKNGMITPFRKTISIVTLRPFILSLTDTEWPFTYTDHDREIVRAIVVDDEGYYYFCRVNRDDDFGRSVLIETSGGGVEPGEDFLTAIRRELHEELGAEVEVLGEIGLVSDYYNLIHRHNLNHYYLCRTISFGASEMTLEEKEQFHLSTLRLTYEEAIAEYERCRNSRLGRLIANRELPVLKRAKEMAESGTL